MKQIDRSHCIYCGTDKDITSDHIPPRSLFRNRAGLQLITVPACRRCNESYKKDDEYFRICVTGDISRNTQGFRLWYEKVMGSTLKRSPKLRAKLISNTKPIYIKKEDGSILKAAEMRMEKSRIDRVLERIVKGLYWHHRCKCLPADTSFETHPKPLIKKEGLDILLSRTRLFSIGDEEFKYRFRTCDNDETRSIWGLLYGYTFFNFYKPC